MQSLRERNGFGAVDLDQRSKAAQRIRFRLNRDHMPQPIEPARFRQDYREHAVFRHHPQRPDGVGGLQQLVSSCATRSADSFGNRGAVARQAARAGGSPVPAPKRASNR